MSQAALKTFATIRPATAQPYFSAAVNGSSIPQYAHIKQPPQLEFRATSAPTFKWVEYPNGTFLRLNADHTENGLTRSFQIVFWVKPTSTTYTISEYSDTIALTYYSDPVNAALHLGVGGSITIEYDEAEETLSGKFNGLFDHGGDGGADIFPIDGSFYATGCKPTRT